MQFSTSILTNRLLNLSAGGVSAKIGNGVAVSDGSVWSHARKALRPIFKKTHSDGLGKGPSRDTFQECLNVFRTIGLPSIYSYISRGR